MESEFKKTIWCIFLSLFFVLCCALPGKAITPKETFGYRSIGDVEVSPDGNRAVFTLSMTDLENNTRHSNLWLIDLKTGKYFQLTQGEKAKRSPAWSPDGKKIAFFSNREGPNQIWMISPDGGEAEPAANFGRVNVMQYRWLPQGDGFIFTAVRPQQPQTSAPQPQRSRERRPESRPIIVDKSVTHYNLRPRTKVRLLKVRFGDKRPEMLIKEDCHILSFDISPDGETVVFSSQPGSGRLYEGKADLRILDLETGVIRGLVKLPGSDTNPRFSPDGKTVAFIRDEGRLSNRTLHTIGVDGGGLKEVIPAYDENIRNFDWSPDNEHILFLGSQGISSVVFRVDVSAGRYDAVEALDGLHVCKGYSFSKDGRTGAAVISDAQSPEEIYVIEDTGETKRKLTRINRKFEVTAPITEVLRYKAKDGLDLEGLVLKPKDFEEGIRYPLLVIVHGGPAGVFTYGFNPGRGAYPLFSFVEQGYVLFLPNPRGSSGYGEKFRQANFQDLGGKDYEDIMTGVDLLIEKGIADADRMGLMGWSYGGEMAYWTVTQTDRFKAISAGAGLTDLISFYGTNDAEGAGMETYFDSKPWENPKLFLDHSALFFVQNAKTPLLIQHGENDRRVPLAQAQEFYLAAIKVGLTVEMVVYPNQGHGISEPKLSLAAMEKNLEWFNKWVLGIEPQENKE